MNFKAILGGLPPVLQYIAVICFVMLILYICLTLTRLIGKGKGETYSYDDNEKNDRSVPDLFGATAFRRNTRAQEEQKKDE